jgi:hypothetical protein
LFTGGVFVGSISADDGPVHQRDHHDVYGGDGRQFTVTTAGPTPTLSVTGTLPSDVTFTDNGDGTGTLAVAPESATMAPIR